ncbi:MAG TPA: NAD(+) synthase, partial [bacterium (Candidatus Stahlbacteria)]|nr:NAD(+) synthase [Candidatus Stahlbacteria bacterium]
MVLVDELKIDAEKVAKQAVDFIKDRVKAFRRNGVIFGLSGGLDSSCIAGLCARAIDKEKILGLIMPERDSSPSSSEDAERVAEVFDIKTLTIDLTPILEKFGLYELLPIPEGLLNHKLWAAIAKGSYRVFPKSISPFVGGLLGTRRSWLRQVAAYYRIKHRVRMVNLYYHAERNNYLVVGTSNKTESMTGLFVKYGDGAADIMPIASLYKTQVKALAEYLGVPKVIIEKKPTPDLIPGMTDELVLGLPYEKIDLILLGLEKGMNEYAIAKELNIRRGAIEYIKKLN